MTGRWRARLLAALRRAPRLHYRHQAGTCPARHDCPGHTTRANRAGFARIEALRLTGRLSYVGPDAPPAWLTRLTSR
ncbi:hypothetical protein ACH4T9_31060 [Micromonospora sp. NPDC020750]|uniref:hypothetical protein n=1 Tax=unclassified Micromonospora TaxID=2617518 RepID=UPI003789E9B6